MSWRELAACLGMDTDLFFPTENIGGPRTGRGIPGERERIDAAKKICADCGVKGECLDFALENREEFGVWAGLTPSERNKISRERYAA